MVRTFCYSIDYCCRDVAIEQVLHRLPSDPDHVCVVMAGDLLSLIWNPLLLYPVAMLGTGEQL
jgi:hypothetical protein